MNGIAAGADPRLGACCKPAGFIRCSASTSGRPFGTSPSQDRHCSGPQRSENAVSTWPVNVKPSQRLARLEAVRGNRQERTKKSSETPQVHSFHCMSHFWCSPCWLTGFWQPQTRQGEQNIMAQSAGYMTGLVNDLLYGVNMWLRSVPL